MDYDIKITGGTIIDGTGAPGKSGDVGIKDGKVVALGEAQGEAGRTIEADGMVVCPGFVDIHTHYDAQILWDRMMTISPWHGVTTVVMGNCGFGVAPTRKGHRDLIMRTLENVEGMSYEALQAGLGSDWPFETFPEYLNAVEQRGSAINVASFIGHTPVRLYVMGEEAADREATDDEIRQMRQVVQEALEAGALGFATSKSDAHVGFRGKPVPSRLATFDEILLLSGAMREGRRGVMQAAVGKTLLHDELRELSRHTGRTITWTALLSGMGGPGGYKRHLERTGEAVAEGHRIVPQVACRRLMFEFQFAEPFIFGPMDVFRPVFTADQSGRAAMYADPEFRARFKERSGKEARNQFQNWTGRSVVAMNPQDPSMDERAVEELAAERGVHPIDFVLDVSLETDLKTRFRMAVFNYEEEEVEALITDPNTVIGLSDAGAHASQLCDACFSTHLLQHWQREKGVLSLEQAVYMLTGRPAQVVGLADRGRLAEGLPADVTVFDPRTVGHSRLKRVHDLPNNADRLIAEATGIHAVIVNGTLLRLDDQDQLAADGALPGRLLRGQPDAKAAASA